MRKLFGTDGIRGVAGAELSCRDAMRIGEALGRMLAEMGSRMRVCVGWDTRISSEMLGAAICSGLASVGCEAFVLGTCSTPAIAYVTRSEGLGGGVVISASHNPYEFNGIKVFGSDGMKLCDKMEERIEEIFFDSEAEMAVERGIGRIKYCPELLEKYKSFLYLCTERLDGMKIAIDCANGATYSIAPELLRELGAECIAIGCEPSGVNINDGCGSTDTKRLREAVTQYKCDAGIALDGDGDRCIAVDEMGNVVDGDYIMAIFALKMKAEGRLNGNAVIGTVMTNLGFKRFCDENEIGFEAAAVGDRYVLEKMLERSYSLGGEQSGHIIMSDLATTGDGLLTAISLISHVKKSGKRLSALATVMKKYPQYTMNISADSEKKKQLSSNVRIKSIIRNVEERLGASGRILVRASGTEPLIRIMTESESVALAKECCELAAREIEAALD